MDFQTIKRNDGGTAPYFGPGGNRFLLEEELVDVVFNLLLHRRPSNRVGPKFDCNVDVPALVDLKIPSVYEGSAHVT